MVLCTPNLPTGKSDGPQLEPPSRSDSRPVERGEPRPRRGAELGPPPRRGRHNRRFPRTEIHPKSGSNYFCFPRKTSGPRHSCWGEFSRSDGSSTRLFSIYYVKTIRLIYASRSHFLAL